MRLPNRIDLGSRIFEKAYSFQLMTVVRKISLLSDRAASKNREFPGEKGTNEEKTMHNRH